MADAEWVSIQDRLPNHEGKYVVILEPRWFRAKDPLRRMVVRYYPSIDWMRPTSITHWLDGIPVCK